ncbi:Protein of unknown function [Pyronema omphalodes CBS 100304]|uniref:Uncharacterized protein n=1 Tax=Pyronema omphalodes (strain CBS 100304) TaxID=1076935 RepID=U4L3L7_PYROM|nr:Protein of unknown function [Pyronema omphalodes CBS 100304]
MGTHLQCIEQRSVRLHASAIGETRSSEPDPCYPAISWKYVIIQYHQIKFPATTRNFLPSPGLF